MVMSVSPLSREFPARVPADNPDGYPDEHRYRGRDHADQERYARAEYHARKHVAALVVRAHPVVPVRRHAERVEVYA